MHMTNATWYVNKGKRAKEVKAITVLLKKVRKQEKNTWGYLVPFGAAGSSPSEEQIQDFIRSQDQKIFHPEPNAWSD